jgi:phosphoglycolate phosphatase
VNAILFDLDGTLTDPREGITRSIAYALERMGREAPPLDSLLFAIGPPLRASLARLLRTDDRSEVERALAFYRERFGGVGLFENAPYAGVAETLVTLREEGRTLFVATSKPTIYAERIIRHFAFETHFEAVHGCELDGTNERKVDLLGHLMACHGLDSRRTALVGDRDADMIAARHHGARAIGALWGYGSREELADAGAHHFAGDIREVAALLREIAAPT